VPLYEIDIGNRGTVTVEANTEEEARGLIERDIKATATRQAAVPYLDDLLFDYETGVRGKGIRAKLARADNFEERQNVAINLFGSDGFTYNSRGQMALTPTGLKKLGLEPDVITLGDGSKLALNRIIDENSFGFSQGDLADFAGMTGPLVGALTFLTPQAKILGGISKALQFFNGGPRLARVLAAGSGSAVGKAGEEAVESIQGLQEQDAAEVGNLLKNEFVIGGVAQGIGEAIGVGYGLLLGKQGPYDNLRLFRQGVQGRSLDDIMKLDKKLGREATEAEIKKGITNGTIKVYKEKALPSQAAFGRNLPGRFQGLFEQVLGNQRSEKTKAYLFREVAELYNKINKNNQLSGELKDVISGYAGRTAMSKAQKAQLDGSVKQALANIKQAEVATVQGAQKYFKDVVNEFGDMNLEALKIADPQASDDILKILAETRESLFGENLLNKYALVDDQLRQTSSQSIRQTVFDNVINPRLDQADKILKDFALRNKFTVDLKPIGDNVAFNDNPYQYLKGLVGRIKSSGNEDLIKTLYPNNSTAQENARFSLVSLRNAISEIKSERDLFITQSQKGNLADKVIAELEGALSDLASPSIAPRLKKVGIMNDDLEVIARAGRDLLDANAYSADVLQAYDSALINKIVGQGKYGAVDSYQIYDKAVRAGKPSDLRDIFKATKDYDDYLKSIGKSSEATKTLDLRNSLKQKLMSDAYEESYDPVLDTIDFSKFATYLMNFDKRGGTAGKLTEILGRDSSVFIDTLKQINKLKPNIKGPELESLIARFTAKDVTGLQTEKAGRSFLDELEKLAKAKAETQALEGNLIISKLPEATTEEVVSKIFTPQGASNIRLVRETVGEEAFSEIQNNAMNKMLQRAIDFDGMAKGGDIAKIFQADKFENIVRSYGDETLEAMFGQDVAQGINNLARTIQSTTAKEVGRGGAPGTLVAAAIAINSFNPVIWPTIGGMAVLRSAFQNPFFLKLMARTDKSAAVQLIEVFERMLRIGGIQELSRATGTAIEDLEETALEQMQATDIDEQTQNEINNIIRETEGRLRARPAIELPDVARVPIFEPNLPGIEQKSVFEREQELGFKPII
jgi:hypothetical protein